MVPNHSALLSRMIQSNPPPSLAITRRKQAHAKIPFSGNRDVMRVKNFTTLWNRPACLVRFNHVVSFVVNAHHGVVLPAVELRVVDCAGDCVWVAIPQPTEWKRVGNQIDAAMIFAWGRTS
jgi:hypothetical protein